MPVNDKLYMKLIEPFTASAIPRSENNITRNSRFDKFPFKWKYHYIDNMVDFAVTCDTTEYDGVYKFNEYMRDIINLPLSHKHMVISERTMKYIVIHFITTQTCYKLGNTFVSYEKHSQDVYKFITEMINDKLVDPNIMLNIAFEYGEHMKSCGIIETLLPLCKLTIEQMDQFAKHYKNGDIYTVNHFVNWGIHPSEAQINSLISNKNTFDDKFLKEFNIQLNSGYIVACIGAGYYNIPGVRSKQKLTLTDDQKKLVSVSIFRNDFTKSQIETLRKQYDLTFDIDCMLALCKNSGSMALFNYLADQGIKPNMECICHLIPKHCGHAKVRDILKRCSE